MAIELGAAHLDGVRLCLRQLQDEWTLPQSLNLNIQPELAVLGGQPVNLYQYDRLLDGK
jgi:hypothetical protein